MPKIALECGKNLPAQMAAFTGLGCRDQAALILERESALIEIQIEIQIEIIVLGLSSDPGFFKFLLKAST